MALTQFSANCGYILSRKMLDGGEDILSADGLAAYLMGKDVSMKPMIRGNWNWDVQQTDILGLSYQELLKGNKQVEGLEVTCSLVNGVPFKLFSGYEDKEDVSYVENSIHVMKPMPTTVGRLQRINLIKERSDYTLEYPASFCDEFSLAFETKVRKLGMTSKWFPYKRVKNTATPLSYSYPKTAGAVQMKGDFTNLTVATWNSEPWSRIDSFDCVFKRSGDLLDVNASGEHIYNEPRSSACAFTINCYELATGQLDDIEAGTQRDINFRVTKANTDHYIDITLYNALVGSPQDEEERGKAIMYPLAGYCENWKIISSDGIADIYYDEPIEV